MSAKITNRTAAFQGLRIIALLCVLLNHSGGINIPLGIAMSFFFVISGFLYRDNGGDYWRYFQTKFMKIFPIFWLTFIIDFFLNQRAFSLDMISHLLLLQTYYPMPEVSYDVVPFYYEYLGVSWFISCLFFCYILSPFIHRLLEGARKEVLILLLIALITIECVYLSLDIPAEYQKWCFYVSPYNRLLEYATGMVLMRIIVNTPPRNPFVIKFIRSHNFGCISGHVVDMGFWYVLHLTESIHHWLSISRRFTDYDQTFRQSIYDNLRRICYACVPATREHYGICPYAWRRMDLVYDMGNDNMRTLCNANPLYPREIDCD